MTQITNKCTEKGKHYWNNEGVYDKEFTQLTEELVPATGMAKNLRGELVRAANRLYYEYCNNGNCNAAEPVYSDREYDDDEEYEEDDEYELVISEFYENFITIIRETLTHSDDVWSSDKAKQADEICDRIRDLIVTETESHFSETDWNWYDRLIDVVYEWCAVHPTDERPIPNWYDN